jgi:hypothetical protein
MSSGYKLGGGGAVSSRRRFGCILAGAGLSAGCRVCLRKTSFLVTGTILQIDPRDNVAVALVPLAAGEATIAGCADRLLELSIEVASGERLTKAELLGQNDFIPWKRGVSL